MGEFERRFKTEAACHAWLRARRWGHGFVCRCGNTRSWSLVRRRLEQCTACGRQTSITACTIFHGSRKPLRVWFRAMLMWVEARHGLSARELARRLRLSYETAWRWLHVFRSAVGERFAKEALCAEVMSSRTRVSARARPCIAVARELREGGRVRLRVAPGSRAFRRFEARHGAKRGRNLNVATLLRRSLIGTYHGAVRPRHLQRYLDEFMFRFNRRRAHSSWKLFDRLNEALDACAAPDPGRQVMLLLVEANAGSAA